MGPHYGSQGLLRKMLMSLTMVGEEHSVIIVALTIIRIHFGSSPGRVGGSSSFVSSRACISLSRAETGQRSCRSSRSSSSSRCQEPDQQLHQSRL